MSDIERRLVIIFFEFFKDVNLEELENKMRSLVKRGELPPFSMMLPMIHYKGLKSIGGYRDILTKEFPMVFKPDEFKFSRGKYDNIVKRERVD